MADLLTLSQYTVRRKIFKIFGGAFHVYDPMGRIVGYSKMAAFKLKEDIRLYADESMRTELLVIQARQVIDFSAAYDVYDPAQRAKIGVLRRRGFKSLLKDEWEILNADDQQIGTVQEDSWLMATLRRFLTNLIPQSYHIDVQGAPVAIIRQNFNPFVLKLNVDLTQDARQLLDRRLALAATILLAAIEGRQN
ncbi:MAG: hypothetical protein NTU53_01835 [Planctomycetota bacterium]|nr:hypothetical protein [Planctomycetota bacterium]